MALAMETTEQFCLRWNNHHGSVLSVFESLLHTEAFTDVTLAVDGAAIKCHRMVLAACSPYLHALLSDHLHTHPILVLKDIRLQEMRALLQYMYRGEVNVAHEQLAALLKVAETLQIKGLVEDRDWSADRGAPGGAARAAPPERATIEPRQPCPDSNRRSPDPPAQPLPVKPSCQRPEQLAQPAVAPAPQLVSPQPLHPAAAAAAAAAELQQKPPAVPGRRGADAWCQSNPILRTVLGHGGMSGLDVPSLMAAALARDASDREYADRQVMSSTGSEENQGTPGTPTSEPDVDKLSNGSVTGELPPHWDPSLSGYMSSFINFAPTPMRPEWKRYKQYSKSDLQQALDAVKGGMTALQASRKFHVPSRTLYDKIKKLGIPTMPRRYPRSVTGGAGGGGGGGGGTAGPAGGATSAAVPGLLVYPPPVAPPHSEDERDSGAAAPTQHRPPPANGDNGDVQRQPLELVVERRRHCSDDGGGGGNEHQLGDDGLKRHRAESDDGRQLDVVA